MTNLIERKVISFTVVLSSWGWVLRTETMSHADLHLINEWEDCHPSFYLNKPISPPSGLDSQPRLAYAVIRYLNKEVDRLFLGAAHSLLPHSNGFWAKWTVWFNGKASSILGFGVIVATIRHWFPLFILLRVLPPHMPRVEGEIYSLSWSLQALTHVSSVTSVYQNEAGRRCHLCCCWWTSVWRKTSFSEGRGIGSNAWACLRR